MSEQEQLMKEIQDLTDQKQKLSLEIDEMESKLTTKKTKLTNEIEALKAEKKILVKMGVKGKIQLQCGTETMIEPQFNLKLDPALRIESAHILAAIVITDQFGRIDRNLCPDFLQVRQVGFGRSREACRIVPLWDRFGAIQVD